MAKRYLTKDITLYVTKTGNDDSGDGSAENPFATLIKALSVIPKNLAGYSATIHIAVGTYDLLAYGSSLIQIHDYTGGRLIINSDSSNKPELYIGTGVLDTRRNSSFMCSNVVILGDDSKTGCVVVSGDFACFRSCKFKKLSTGIDLGSGARAYVSDCEFTDNKTALMSSDASTMAVFSCRGSGNSLVYSALVGIIQTSGGINGTTLIQEREGGRVFQ